MNLQAKNAGVFNLKFEILFWMSNVRERAKKQFKLPKRENRHSWANHFSTFVIFHVCVFFLGGRLN